MSINNDVGYVTWKQSQLDPVIRDLMQMQRAKKWESIKHQHIRLSPHGIPPWFSTPSTSTPSSTFASNSLRKLRPMKPISKKVPPLHAYSSTAPVKDGISSESELAARYLHIICNGTVELGDFAPNESFLMHVDDVLPHPKRAVGRTPSIVMDASPVASSSNSGSMPPSKALAAASTSASTSVPEKIPQSRHVVAPSATQRGPPLLRICAGNTTSQIPGSFRCNRATPPRSRLMRLHKRRNKSQRRFCPSSLRCSRSPEARSRAKAGHPNP
ncbi:hypothetical protein EV424DRAFT_1546618 [Suillus variegatus]|nr:hypothetical protein EV424DRAFT_1546618 [Suillus variegatus]